MKRITWFIALLMIPTMIWTSCSKNKSTNTNSNPNESLMTQAVWKYDTSGIDLNKDGAIDLADTLEPCFKDNTYQFNKDSTVVLNEGATKCNDTDPQTATYTWSITESTPAIIKSDVDPILASGLKVKTLTSTQLTVYKDTTILGVSFWFILSLKH